MARLAGRKKDGAWSRTVDIIKNKFGNSEREAVINLLDADTEVTAMAVAYLAIIAAAGVVSTDTSLDLITAWVNSGIPREVWHGYARYDTYSKPTGKSYYVGEHAVVIRKGANAMRAIITNYISSWRMLLDLQNFRPANQGNPGGVALGPRHEPPPP